MHRVTHRFVTIDKDRLELIATGWPTNRAAEVAIDELYRRLLCVPSHVRTTPKLPTGGYHPAIQQALSFATTAGVSAVPTTGLLNTQMRLDVTTHNQ